MKHEWRPPQPLYAGQALCYVEGPLDGMVLTRHEASERQLAHEVLRLAEAEQQYLGETAALVRENERLAERVRELEGILADGGRVLFVHGPEMIDEQKARAMRAHGKREQRIAALEESLAIARRGEEHEAEQRDLANQKLAALEEYLRDVRERLRIECAELGDNDWPDDLHLGDVAEKYLARLVAARIEELETAAEQERRSCTLQHERADALEKENRRLKEISGLALEDVDRGRKWCQRLLPAEEAHKAITSLDRALYHFEGVDRDFLDGDVDDLRGFVVWHRHDGDLVKLVPVSEAEEVSGVISVSYDPGKPS